MQDNEKNSFALAQRHGNGDFFLHGIPQLQNQTNISVLQWSATCIVVFMQEPAHLWGKHWCDVVGVQGNARFMKEIYLLVFLGNQYSQGWRDGPIVYHHSSEQCRDWKGQCSPTVTLARYLYQMLCCWDSERDGATCRAHQNLPEPEK